MNNVALHPAAVAFSSSQLALIKNTVAADCSDGEFNLFVSVARATGLDPLRKQIYALVYNKDKPDKRRMSIITGIDGMRAVAARSKRYRPDEEEPRFEYDEALKGPLNPLGIVKATVRIWIKDADRYDRQNEPAQWYPATGVAYWDEFAPIVDIWGKDEQTGKWQPTGAQKLDGNWPKMGRVMISKCSEASVLRKAFPEDLSSVYERAELDQALAQDALPTEILAQVQEDRRLALAGGKDAILFQLEPAAPLRHIKLGEVVDRIMEATREYVTADQVDWFMSANRDPLKDFWARAKGDALAIKQHLDGLRTKLAATDEVVA